MSKIIVYSQEGFGGRSAEFTNNVGDLQAVGFNNTIASLKVIGQSWVGYYDKDFAGKQRVFEQGDYPILEDNGKFSSLKKITNDLSNPEIQLFEHINYQGRSVTLRSEINLTEIGFNDKASSHKVRGGVWVLYEHINRQGSQLVSFPGENVSNYVPLSFNDKASCVRPLLPRP